MPPASHLKAARAGQGIGVCTPERCDNLGNKAYPADSSSSQRDWLGESVCGSSSSQRVCLGEPVCGSRRARLGEPVCCLQAHL